MKCDEVSSLFKVWGHFNLSQKSLKLFFLSLCKRVTLSCYDQLDWLVESHMSNVIRDGYMIGLFIIVYPISWSVISVMLGHACLLIKFIGAAAAGAGTGSSSRPGRTISVPVAVWTYH